MKLRRPSAASLSFPLAAAIAALLAAPFATATPYYWDVNGTTAGFSTVVGAWNGTNAFWGPNEIGTGGTYIAAPTTSDDLFINAATTNTGSITVTGTQSAGTITFGTTVGATTLSGGTITMGAAATITANNWNTSDVITSILGGAATSLTKAGYGGLNLQGVNTYTGATVLNGYGPSTATTISGAAGTINTSSGITLNGTTLTLTNATTQGAVDRLNSSAASLITSNSGTLNYGNAVTASNTYAETAGILTLTRGQLNVSLTGDLTSVASTQTLTFGGLTQAGTSAVQFSAAGTGPQVSGLKNMIVVSGAGTTAANTIIGSYATVGTTSALQTDYAVYNANFVVGAGIVGTTEANWTTAGQAFTQSASETLGATRTITALRNTGGTATTALAGNFLETFGLLNAVSTAWTISGAGGLRQQGTAAANLNVSAGSGAITISSQVTDNTGALTLVKNGALALTLSNAANNYSGGTVINGGALNFVNGALGTTGSITINSVAGIGTNQAGVARLQWGDSTDISARLNLVNDGYAMLDTTGNTVTLATAFGSSSSSSLGKTGTGTLNLDGINTYTGSTDVYNGTVVVNAAQATTRVRVGHSTSNGGGSGVILRLGASNLLPSTVAVIVDGQSANTLDLQTFNQTVGALSLGSNNGSALGTVTGTGSSTLTLTAGVTMDGHNNGSGTITVPFLDLNGAIQNFGIVGSNSVASFLTVSSVIQNGGITKTGTSLVGFLALSGANTFSGATTNGIGMLRLNNSLALQNSPLDTAASVTGDANNGLRTTVTTLTLGGLTGNKNLAALFTTNGTNPGQYNTVTALTLNPGTGQTYSYSAVIANGAAGMTLTKSGAGTQTLSGVNTYTGTTTISGGTLLVNSPGSLHASSAVTVSTGTGGTLGGNGTINGSVTVAADGSIAPGASAGTLTIGGNLDTSAQAAGSGKLKFELDALANTNDKIAVTGTLTIGVGALGFSDFTFTNLGGLQVTGGTPYKLITSGGITALNTLDPANLTGSLPGGLLTGTLQISGNDIELVVTLSNTAPTISDVTNLSIPSGGTTGPLSVTVGDAETAVGSLVVTGSSSNTTLVPNANVVIGGSGASRTVTVTPVSGLTGTSTITVTVDDGSLTTSDTFVLTVTDNYLSWATANSVTGGVNGDSDNDGVKNLVEYALVDGGERGVLSGNTITFTKRGAPYGSDLTYDIESSTDLVGWGTLAKPPVVETGSSISYTFTPSTPVKNFARLRVVITP